MRICERRSCSWLICVLLCCTFILFTSASLFAEEIQLEWDPTPGSIGGYNLYYGTSSRNYTIVRDVGNQTTYTLNLDITQQHYYMAVTAYNVAGDLESGFSNEVTTAPQLMMDKSTLYFNATSDRRFVTSPQTVLVNIAGFGSVQWTATSNRSWLNVSPLSGADRGSFTVSCNAGAMPLGPWSGTITISSPDAYNSPQVVNVVGNGSGTTNPPYGTFDTPVDGTTGITGAIAVTGWALDDIEVTDVKIWRDPVAGEGSSLIYIGDSVFVEGARPDVEAVYPGTPFNYRGGWGYMLLTYGLPNQGNGTYRIHAFATDQEGHQVWLGSKTIAVDNANAARPFGAIDTPAQGGTASGLYWNWGWVLTPQPYTMDGSTIQVYVDGELLGTVDYGYYRSDIATVFPGYVNSNNAVGLYQIDTRSYDNGVHTIMWYAVDSNGRTEGIGSRFFIIDNTGSGDQAQMVAAEEETLYFGAVEGDVAVSPVAEVDLSPSHGGRLEWETDAEQGFIHLSPNGGTSETPLAVAVSARNLTPGRYEGTVGLWTRGGSGSLSSQIRVVLSVYEEGETLVPFGALDTPPDGAVGVRDYLAVTGWVLDDIGTTRVEIYRDPLGDEETAENGLVYLGEAEFAAGARPDVERRYGTYPLSKRAGWGYQLDTRALPFGGSGTFTLRAIAVDEEGQTVEIGVTTVVCTNAFSPPMRD